MPSGWSGGSPIPYGAEFAGGQWNASPDTQNFRPHKNYQTLSIAQHALWQNYMSLHVSWNKQSGRFNCMTKRFATAEWGRAYYDAQRANGKAQDRAVRSLAFKWVRILFRRWKSRRH